MTINRFDNLIEIKADDNKILKDIDGMLFRGICFNDEGQTDEELMLIYTEHIIDDEIQSILDNPQ